MKKLSFLFNFIFVIVLTAYCGGGAGTGATVLPTEDGSADQVVSDTPADGSPVVVPEADATDYSSSDNDSTSSESTQSATTEQSTEEATSDDAAATTSADSSSSSSDSSASTDVASDASGASSTETPQVDPNDVYAQESTADETDVNEDLEPEDSVVSDADNFDFATVHFINAQLSIFDMESKTGISQVSIDVYDSSTGELLTSAYTGTSGKAVFDFSASQYGTELTIVLKKAGYTPDSGYFITVPDASAISEIVRDITLSKIDSSSVAVADRDNDGIQDLLDEFPDNKALAKKVSNSYLLAFEDKYPGKSNADFNDDVIRLELDELLNSNGLVAGVKVRSQVLAAGSAKQSVFAININGQSYTIIKNVKAELADGWNTRLADVYKPGAVDETEILFKNPVERSSLGAAPFDPYLIPDGAVKKNVKKEIHLSFVKSKYNKKRLGKDGMTYALLLPVTWIWPGENKAGIFRTYPDFEKWYKSCGKTNMEWYNYPDKRYYFAQAATGSSIAGYLFGTKSMSIITILSMIAIVSGLIAGVRYFAMKKN